MLEWVKIGQDKKEKVGWRWLVHKTFKLPNGNEALFTTYDLPSTNYAGVIALTKENKVIIVRQFRPGPEKIFDEIVGGGVEPGDESIQSAAIREMSEESGYSPGSIIYLGKVYKDAYNNATWHYYLARDCASNVDGQKLDATETAELKLISIEELFYNAKNGLMTDVEAVLLVMINLWK